MNAIKNFDDFDKTYSNGSRSITLALYNTEFPLRRLSKGDFVKVTFKNKEKVEDIFRGKTLLCTVKKVVKFMDHPSFRNHHYRYQADFHSEEGNFTCVSMEEFKIAYDKLPVDKKWRIEGFEDKEIKIESYNREFPLHDENLVSLLKAESTNRENFLKGNYLYKLRSLLPVSELNKLEKYATSKRNYAEFYHYIDTLLNKYEKW